jgi:ADP-heptose:LPS heptosyltransferase
MGIGDELMVTGEVKARAGQTFRRFAVCDDRPNRVRHRWSADAWEGNPRIARPGEPYDEEIFNCPGNRPYIVSSDKSRFVWRPYKPTPGELFLSADEVNVGNATRGAVVIQPMRKYNASENKHWHFDNWARLVKQNPQHRWVQIGPDPRAALPGITEFVTTRTYREACGAVGSAAAIVVLEGGLHHAAAALGIPAVVIYGGYIAPTVTGYEGQQSLYVDDPRHPLGCGQRFRCQHCKDAMAAITPEMVGEALYKTGVFR